MAFIGLSSATYLVNDVRDREADRHHPRKQHRPIASGAVPVSLAFVAAVLLLLLGFGILTSVGTPALQIGIAYVVLTLAYSLWLKQLPILDVMLVALGFVLRATAGAVAIEAEPSPWLYLCTFLLMLMIALGKRRWELINLEYALAHRPNLREYSLPLLDQFLSIVAAMTLMAYAFYTFNNIHVDGPWLMLTIPNVLYGVIRYLALIHVNEQGGVPEDAILRDPATMINLALWIALSAALVVRFYKP